MEQLIAIVKQAEERHQPSAFIIPSLTIILLQVIINIT